MAGVAYMDSSPSLGGASSTVATTLYPSLGLGLIFKYEYLGGADIKHQTRRSKDMRA